MWKLPGAAGALLVVLAATLAHGATVGETHRVTSDATASLRDAQQRPALRITVWYPAAADAVEHDIAIGPPSKPLYEVGSVAPDAAFAPGDDRRPVILLSHGFGGTARIMGWFGIALAREGYIVVAVDHPGNNGVDKMTVAGASLWWDRTEDLRAALTAMTQDSSIGPHMDLARVGVAGFSAGGFTALVAAGARVQPLRLRQLLSRSSRRRHLPAATRIQRHAARLRGNARASRDQGRSVSRRRRPHDSSGAGRFRDGAGHRAVFGTREPRALARTR